MLFDWRVSAVTSAHPDILDRMHAVGKEDLMELMESEVDVLHYSLELGDHLLNVTATTNKALYWLHEFRLQGV